MKRTLIMWSVVASAVVLAATLHGQQYPAEHQHETAKTAPARPSQEAVSEIFCPTMKTGQLCSHGTTDALRLTGSKADQWLAAVQKYNESVDLATRQLQVDAKATLTPQQFAEVQRWFAVGLNPEMNRILQQRVTNK